MPSHKSLKCELVEFLAELAGKNCTKITMIKNPIPDKINALIVPALLIINPAIAGAIILVPVQIEVFKATAFISADFAIKVG